MVAEFVGDPVTNDGLESEPIERRGQTYDDGCADDSTGRTESGGCGWVGSNCFDAGYASGKGTSSADSAGKAG